MSTIYEKKKIFPCDISKAQLNYHGKIHPQSATKSGIVFTVSGDRLSGCRLFEPSGLSQNGKTDQYLWRCVVHIIPVSIIGHVHALFKVRIYARQVIAIICKMLVTIIILVGVTKIRGSVVTYPTAISDRSDLQVVQFFLTLLLFAINKAY